ncbi:hypothetical protein HD806DRAFT_518522 [Xylariaceae sp. AK1471]|nr:hypothetical protein HD806DRAFT_518522 [Xylariaceae sp. AK1471]
MEELTSSAHVCEDQIFQGETAFKTDDFTRGPDYVPPVQQPTKSPTRRRWFSRYRTSSSGTTRRRYDLRSCSTTSDASSTRQSSSSRLLEETSSLGPLESRSSVQKNTLFSSMPPDNYNADCHLLVPRISITPEVHTSNNAISTVWAAIEISVQLSCPCTDGTLNSYGGDGSNLSSPLRAGSVSRFGHLYNLQVNILPVYQTAIIDVIQDDKKRSLNLGSTVLVLAKVKIDRRWLRQPDRPMVQKSNELIANIESQLGSSSVRCLQVRLQYQHSGFPLSNSIAPTDGTADCQTRLETTAIGVIKEQTLHPPWGLSCVSTGESSLLGLVASHWGPLRANEIFFRETSLQFDSIVATNTAHYDSLARIDRESNPSANVPRRQATPQSSSPDQEDPARKIWTQMRRRSSRGGSTVRASRDESLSATASPLSFTGKASTITGPMKMRSDVDRRRELIRNAALRNKRSIGADSLKSLVPSMMDLDITGKDTWGKSSTASSNKENVPPEHKKEGRWSLAGLW